MPAISITPNRISMYPERIRHWDDFLKRDTKPVAPTITKHNGKISAKAKKRIRNACSWLVMCSAKRNIKLQSGKLIKNFQVSFVTLTLPTAQQHTHAEIKKKCLNQFLVQLRQKFGVKNYIWKMELQKNGNVHFHLTFDKYIHYLAIRKYWNQAISKLGYVAEYARKFNTMTESDYINYRSSQGFKDKQRSKKAFAFGISTNWQSPNTTDVKSVKNIRSFASYMAKYLTKDNDVNDLPDEVTAITGELSGRLWFLSTSLSRLTSVKLVFNYDIKELWHRIKRSKKALFKQYDWAASIYFKFSNLSSKLQSIVNEILISEVFKSGYEFPATFPRPNIKQKLYREINSKAILVS